MDAQTLRLILAVVGAVFLIGLYLWEKHRAEGADDSRRERRPAPRARRQHEPNLGRFDDELDDDSASDAYAQAQYAGEPGSGPMAADDSAPRGEPADTGAELLLQLFVTCPDGAFSGDELLDAAERCKLYPGDMDIFHRTRGDVPDGEPLFSMANLVKPGTFPFHDMTDFMSPGLAVFAQFRGEPSDLMVFDEMLDAARTMAELLKGDLRGPDREHLRDADARRLRARVLGLLDGAEAQQEP